MPTIGLFRKMTMPGTILGSAATLMVWATLLNGQQSVGAASVREGRLWFDGRATLGDFTGTTTSVTGRLTGGADLADVRGWVEAPVGTLVTGNDRRDRDLRKSMGAAEFPTLRFDLTGLAVGERIADTTVVQLDGSFTLRGVTRSAKIPARLVLGERRYHLWAATPLNLKDYAIGGLSKMLGLLRMSEDIVVHIDLVFEVP